MRTRPLCHGRRWSPWTFLVWAACVGLGCGSSGGPAGSPLAPDVDAGHATPDGSSVDCPVEHIEGPDGACMPVGIQGCAAIFLDPEDGLCKPSMEACPPGTIPRFDQGCVPVGVPGCAPLFVDEETGLCDPDPDLCGPWEVPVPTQGCVPLDGPEGCGEGTWGHLVLEEDDQHVDPAYPGEDSDGSRDRPWTNIAIAQAYVPEGRRILLAAGTYDKGVPITLSLSLVGRCPSMVHLTGLTAYKGDVAALAIAGPVDVVVRGVHVRADGYGVVIVDSAHVLLERVYIDNTVGAGVGVQDPGSFATVRRSLIAWAHSYGPDGKGGRGVVAQFGAQVILEETALLYHDDLGVFVGGEGSRADLTDCLVARTQPAAHLAGYGRGVAVENGAAASIVYGVVADVVEQGVAATDQGSSLHVRESCVLRTLPDVGSGDFGRGVRALSGASLDLRQTAVVGNHTAALRVSGLGTEAEVVGNLLASTQPAVGQAGRGATVRAGAHASLTHNAVVDNEEIGIQITDSGTQVQLVGNLIAGTRPRASDGAYGRGVNVQFGAQVTLEGNGIRANHAVGIHVLHEGTTASLLGDLVIDTRSDPDSGYGGSGVGASEHAWLEVISAGILENRAAAIAILGASGAVKGSLLAGTMAQASGLADGLIASGSVVTLEGSIVRGNERAGVLYDRSDGVIRHCLVSQNAFGLVTQGNPQPAIENTVASGNEIDVVIGGGLEVPNESTAVPDKPDPAEGTP